MPKCPICQTDYVENQSNFCSTCSWDLKPYPMTFPGHIPDEFLEKERAKLTWAKAMWQRFKAQDSELQAQQQSEKDREAFNSQLIKISGLQAKLDRSQQEVTELRSRLSKVEDQLEQSNLEWLQLYVDKVTTEESASGHILFPESPSPSIPEPPNLDKVTTEESAAEHIVFPDFRYTQLLKIARDKENFHYKGTSINSDSEPDRNESSSFQLLKITKMAINRGAHKYLPVAKIGQIYFELEEFQEFSVAKIGQIYFELKEFSVAKLFRI
jgi:hypothetical protein